MFRLAITTPSFPAGARRGCYPVGWSARRLVLAFVLRRKGLTTKGEAHTLKCNNSNGQRRFKPRRVSIFAICGFPRPPLRSSSKSFAITSSHNLPATSFPLWTR